MLGLHKLKNILLYLGMTPESVTNSKILFPEIPFYQ